jgi:hypothetical protein
MSILKSILKFLNVLDANENLSITNLAVIVALVKLAIAPTASITEAGTLLIALANYGHKRFVNAQEVEVPEDTVTPKVEAMQTKLDEVTSQVSTLVLQSGMKILK